jgi:TonB family protein
MTMLLDSAIKVSIVLLVALGAAGLLRRQSAATRHWGLSVAILLALAMPMLAPIAPSWHPGVDAVAIFAAARGSQRPHGAVRTSTGVTWTAAEFDSSSLAAQDAAREARRQGLAARAGGGADTWLTGVAWSIGAVWLTGVVISLSVLLVGLGRLAWLASHARPLRSGRWNVIAGEIADEYGLRRPIALLQLHGDRPALLVTWGLRRPKILLPPDANDWTDDRIRIVLSHELAHVRRQDWAIQIAATLLRALHWFNPLAWIVCRRLRQESEQACDDVVLARGVDGAQYATHLLELARAAAAHHRAALPAQAIARSTGLERRITAMLNTRVNRYALTRPARFAIAAALSIVALPIAGFDALAQTGPARLSGSIVDQSGAPVPRASVELTDTRTQARQNMLSDDLGRFAFVDLAAGEYRLAAATPGFEASSDTVRLAAGELAQQDIRLRIGQIQETVTVGKGTGAPEIQERSAASAQAQQDGFGGSIRPPLKIKSVNPIYPPALQSAGTGDRVVLDARVGTDGSVADIKVRTSKVPELASTAVDAVRQWQFIPTRLHGKPVDTRITIVVDFTGGQ